MTFIHFDDFMFYPKEICQVFYFFTFFSQPEEDPTIYLQKRSLSSPVIIFDGSNCLLAIGTTPITTFAKEDLSEGLLYLMALSDGLLLHPSSYLSQMRGDSPFCHSERNIAGHTP